MNPRENEIYKEKERSHINFVNKKKKKVVFSKYFQDERDQQSQQLVDEEILNI